MDGSTQVAAEPTPPVREPDAPAVAIGNASMLGIGYFMLGRRLLGVAAVVVTIGLCGLVAGTVQLWSEVLVVVWWVAVIVHGWFLAGGSRLQAAARGRRLGALAIAVPVLLVVGLVRADAASVEDRAATARSDGDCEKVVRARGDLWFGHRIAGARDAAGVDGMVKLCERLRAADGKLSEGLSGNRAALDDGYRILAAALEDSSDNRATVTTVLDSFLSGLRRDDPCQTVTVTDWLLGRDKNGNILDTSADVAAKTAPQALIDCADARMSESDWDEAQVHYQQVLDEYPDEVELGSQARTGVGRATRAIELKQVRGLLRTNTPGYCAEPAKYSGAAPFRKGTNRVLFVGDGRSGQLPGTWRTDDPERAVLIACVGDEERGVSARTCPYTYGPSGRSIANVTFHKIAIPVRVFELRTGKLVADRKLQISGASCPPKIKYYSDYFSDHGPDKHQDVKPSREDIRRAYRPLIFK